MKDLEVKHTVHLWRDGKRIVDFLEFSKGVGHFERKFWVDGNVARNSSSYIISLSYMDLLDREMM